jgi:hypothetical protein
MKAKKVNKTDALLIAYYNAVSDNKKHEAKILLDEYAAAAVREKVRIETEFAVSIFAVLAGTVLTFILI